MSDSRTLLAKAKKTLQDCDYLVDLYDLYFAWVSDNAMQKTGYSLSEITKKRNVDLLVDNSREGEFRKELFERIAKGEGENEYDIKAQNGDILHIKLFYRVFQFEGGWYLAGKLLEVLPKGSLG